MQLTATLAALAVFVAQLVGRADGRQMVRELLTATSITPSAQLAEEDLEYAFLTPEQLVTSCRDGGVRWWSLTTKAVEQTVSRIDVPPLTDAERALGSAFR